MNFNSKANYIIFLIFGQQNKDAKTIWSKLHTKV